MTLRDELLADGKSAYADAQRGYHIDSEADEEDFTKGVAAVVDVVLATGERRWLCGRDDGNCGPDLVADYPGVHNAARGCHEYVVLPVSLREGEPSDG